MRAEASLLVCTVVLASCAAESDATKGSVDAGGARSAVSPSGAHSAGIDGSPESQPSGCERMPDATPTEPGTSGAAGTGGDGQGPGGVNDAPAGARGEGASPGETGGASGLGGASGSSGARSPSDGAAGGGPSDETGVRVEGPDLLVDGRVFHIRGVAWNPVGPGQTHPAGLDYAGYAGVDIPLMQAAGINAVRTYEPLLDLDVFDQLAAAGIRVLNSVYPYGGTDVSVVTERVRAVADHPAMLMWLLGNEWNYNGLYVDMPHDEALARLNEAAALVRAADPDHPIATAYGELPDSSVVEAMPEIDLWAINSYRGLSFGSLFSEWSERSGKPMFLAEYGADAYNALIGSVDLESQAEATTALTREIVMASRAFGSGPCVGGTLFEWADEWWKDQGGDVGSQDVGGIAPGGGPHPDATFNEEWWGIVDIERNPRPAYQALAEVFGSL